MPNSRLKAFQIFNSSLWITVLVVRVGCIIEARPSPNNSHLEEQRDNYEDKVSQQQHHHQHRSSQQQNPLDLLLHETPELETAASQSFLSSPKNALLSNIGADSISTKKQSSTSSVVQQDKHAPFPDSNDDSNERVVSSSPSTPGTILSSSPKRIKSGLLLEITTTTKSSDDTTTIGSITTNANMVNDADDTRRSSASKEEEGTTTDDDSCSGKADGYYQNFGSFCTSYYFCAAGYQITYVCPIGTKFNGKRCEKDYSCPMTTASGHHVGNDCENKSNGYYTSRQSHNNGGGDKRKGSLTTGKYFYCFQQAKVIELQCDAGKIFVKDKCIFHDDPAAAVVVTKSTGQQNKGDDSNVDTSSSSSSCDRKSNGFYQDLGSNCEWYYYCIAGEKRELRCQDEYIFNGDICVHHSRYECPTASQHGSGAGRSTRSVSSAETGQKGKLPIISNPLSSHNPGKITSISSSSASPENDYVYSRRSRNNNNVIVEQTLVQLDR